MTRDDIIRMAREAGLDVHPRKEQVRVGMDSLLGNDSTEKISLFAELAIENFLSKSGQYITNDATRNAAITAAVAAEREACAQACQEVGKTWRSSYGQSIIDGCVAKILARAGGAA